MAVGDSGRLAWGAQKDRTGKLRVAVDTPLPLSALLKSSITGFTKLGKHFAPVVRSVPYRRLRSVGLSS